MKCPLCDVKKYGFSCGEGEIDIPYYGRFHRSCVCVPIGFFFFVPTRICNVLDWYGITRLSDLLEHDKKFFMNLPSMGEKSFDILARGVYDTTGLCMLLDRQTGEKLPWAKRNTKKVPK
ncbi:hypothetical protein MK079_02560 [Candidatus Gracilibacteria bacterium]|nr:hypothetical protein [Candidatus Gracilibacteria bacterium]